MFANWMTFWLEICCNNLQHFQQFSNFQPNCHSVNQKTVVHCVSSTRLYTTEHSCTFTTQTQHIETHTQRVWFVFSFFVAILFCSCWHSLPLKLHFLVFWYFYSLSSSVYPIFYQTIYTHQMRYSCFTFSNIRSALKRNTRDTSAWYVCLYPRVDNTTQYRDAYFACKRCITSKTFWFDLSQVF